jgi:hypothetical protein
MTVRVGAAAVLAGLLALIGCGSPSAKVTGRVTCQGKPVAGSILFSPKGEEASTKGSAVSANLDEDGNYELRLTTIGQHLVVVTPSDIRYPVKQGEVEYPCDRSPQEREIKTGDNRIVIELMKRKP